MTWDVPTKVRTPLTVETLNIDAAIIIRIPQEWERTAEGRGRIESLVQSLNTWVRRDPAKPVIIVPAAVEFLRVRRMKGEEGGAGEAKVIVLPKGGKQ